MIAWAHDWSAYWLHRTAMHLANALPPRVGYAVAASTASAVYLLWPTKRRNAAANMVRVAGRRQATRLARASFRNYARYILDMLRLNSRQLARIEQQMVVFGMEHVEQALARGKGLIIVGGHLGNSDLGAAMLARRGYVVHPITETLHPPRWNALVQETRRLVGVHVIDATANVREILRVLRRNEVLMILVDRPTHREGSGVPVDFFGAPTRVPAGAATLALRTGAGLVAGSLVRTAHGYMVQMQPVEATERGDDLQADIQRLTQQIMLALEALIRQHPDQWSMFRPMWPHEAERGAAPAVTRAVASPSPSTPSQPSPAWA